MSQFIHCDKCDKVIRGEELSLASKIRVDRMEYDLCKKCSKLFYDWIKTPPIPYDPYKIFVAKPCAIAEEKEEEDDTKDIVEAFAKYNKSKIKEEKETDSDLDYPLEKFIDQHNDILFPTDMKPGSKGGMIDYGKMAKTKFIKKLRELQILTIKQFLYSFSDMTAFRSFYSSSTAAINRYRIILRILKTEGYYDSFTVGQKKVLKKMDEEIKEKRGKLCDSGITK